MPSLLAIPQAWVETYRPLPTGWWSNHAEGIERVWPECAETVDRVAREVGVDPRLLVTRMELEQSAISYRWDGSTSHYGGGHDGDARKIKYLCGVDRTDSGDRPGGWFGAERQLLGCALRFRYWYRGLDGPRPEWRNWLGLGATNASATLEGVEAANLATAMCYRYTPHLAASKLLRLIGMEWFPEDYQEATGGETMPPSTVIVLDPGHSDWTHEFPGGYREGKLVRLAALKAQQLLVAEGHRCYLTRTQASEDPSLTSRGKLAVKKGARVFVSLHTDASDSSAARGVHSIFYATSQSEASAPDAQVKAPNGRALARAVAQEVAASMGLPLRNASTGGAAPWWRCPTNLGVLTGGDNWRRTEAACLVEAGFGSSPEDRVILSRSDAPEKYALGVCRGIYRYCGWALPAVWSGETETVPPVTPEVPIEPTDGWAKEVYDAVAWAKVRGVSDGTRLTDPVTRAEVLVMLRRLETREGGEPE
jgi:N-acetylmuramoyl-L-alanine amidase